MIDPDLLIDATEQATKEVFLTMLGADVSREPQGAEFPEGGVVSLVGLTGNYSGTGTISCTPAVAMRVAASMLMLDPSEGNQAVDDDVLDAVAELTNMVVGNIKNALADKFGEMAISIPTVVYGRNFRFKNIAAMREVSVLFRWEEDLVQVKICLAPTFEKSSSARQKLEAPAFSAA